MSRKLGRIIYLDPDKDKLLKEIVTHKGQKVSAVIAKLVDEYLAREAGNGQQPSSI